MVEQGLACRRNTKWTRGKEVGATSFNGCAWLVCLLVVGLEQPRRRLMAGVLAPATTMSGGVAAHKSTRYERRQANSCCRDADRDVVVC